MDSWTTVPIIKSLNASFDVETELTYELITPPSNGTIGNDLNSFSWDYEPNQDFVGEDTFTYLANDGEFNSEDIATITITIIGGEDAPVLGLIDPFSFDEDEEDESDRTLQVTATDIDQDVLTFTCTESDNISCDVISTDEGADIIFSTPEDWNGEETCLLYTSPSPRD